MSFLIDKISPWGLCPGVFLNKVRVFPTLHETYVLRVRLIGIDKTVLISQSPDRLLVLVHAQRKQRARKHLLRHRVQNIGLILALIL